MTFVARLGAKAQVCNVGGDATFAVGDEVAWTLMLDTNAETSRWPEEMLVELQAKDRRSAVSGTGQEQDILRVAGKEIAADEGVGDTARGALLEDHHAGVPDELLATRGRLRRIRVVSHQLRITGDRLWVPGPGTVRFREVTRVPDAFTSDETAEATHWSDFRVLVDLDPLDPA